jgi:hypothetical protein
VSLKVLAFCSYPIEAAATRYRLAQFQEPLAKLDIDLQVAPFLDSETFATLYDRSKAWKTAGGIARGIGRQLAELVPGRNVDVVFVQRKSMLVGPPLIEWILTRVARRPLILDLDDATYIKRESLVYGRTATLIKWPGKADSLIDLAQFVICGNRNVAAFISSRGKAVEILPTIVDVGAVPSGSEQAGDNTGGRMGRIPFFISVSPVAVPGASARRRASSLQVSDRGRWQSGVAAGD